MCSVSFFFSLWLPSSVFNFEIIPPTLAVLSHFCLGTLYVLWWKQLHLWAEFEWCFRNRSRRQALRLLPLSVCHKEWHSNLWPLWISLFWPGPLCHVWPAVCSAPPPIHLHPFDSHPALHHSLPFQSPQSLVSYPDSWSSAFIHLPPRHPSPWIVTLTHLLPFLTVLLHHPSSLPPLPMTVWSYLTCTFHFAQGWLLLCIVLQSLKP